MLITPAVIRATTIQFSGVFRAALEAVPANDIIHTRLATIVPSTGSKNSYGWLANLPRMREWLGERVVHNLASYKFDIENKTFESTVGVDREDFEDDQLGNYTAPVQMMGYEARKLPDDVIIELLKNGQTRLAFDGQYFFDTDHPVDLGNAGAGTQSNYYPSGKPLNSDNLLAVVSAMRGLVGGTGRRAYGVRPTHLIVPPALEGTARALLNAQLVASGGVSVSNVTQGLLELIVIPELAGEDTAWYVADLSKPIKPLVWQNRRAPQFQALTDQKDNNVFWHRQYIWGVDMRGNGGYGPWFLITKAVA